MPLMILVNFTHPITPDQFKSIEELLGWPVSRLVEVKVHFNQGSPFQAQVNDIVDAANLTGAEWQSEPILVNPPSLAPITALLIAELHGRMGYFPPLIRLRPVAGATPPRFELAEILRLQEVRDLARAKR